MRAISQSEIGPFAHLLQANADVRCVIKDARHRFLYVNETWLICFGYKEQNQVIGLTDHDLFPDWRASRYLAEEKQILGHGAVLDYEELSLNADGEVERWRTLKAPWLRAGQIHGITNIGLRFISAGSLESRSDVVPEIVRRFAKHACGPATIGEIAEELGMSRRTFERRFRRIMQETPQQFRMRCKIAKAKRLLRTDEPLASIAAACCFSDQSHFTNNFVKHVGCSPSRFRKEFARTEVPKHIERQPTLRWDGPITQRTSAVR